MKKLFLLLLTSVVISLIGSLFFIDPKPKLIWNVTASAPKGLYWAASFDRLETDALVVVEPPEVEALFMASRGYLGFGAVLLKRIVALPGTEICRRTNHIFVAGQEIAQAKDTDSQGRHLPQWRGCYRLRSDEIFLVNPDVQDSLDGRYFGPFPRSSIVGLAYPIWVDDEKDSRS